MVVIIHNVDDGESKTIQDRRLNWHEEALEAAGKDIDDDNKRVRFLEAVTSEHKYDQQCDSLIIDDDNT